MSIFRCQHAIYLLLKTKLSQSCHVGTNHQDKQGPIFCKDLDGTTNFTIFKHLFIFVYIQPLFWVLSFLFFFLFFSKFIFPKFIFPKFIFNYTLFHKNIFTCNFKTFHHFSITHFSKNHYCKIHFPKKWESNKNLMSRLHRYFSHKLIYISINIKLQKN